MSQWLHISQSAGGVEDEVRYNNLGAGTHGANPTEANHQQKFYNAYTAKRLSCNCNGIAGNATTVRDRKNGANGSMAVSFSTTGQKEDVTNTTSIAANDLWNYQVVVGTQMGSSVSLTQISVMLDDGGANRDIWHCALGALSTSAFAVFWPGAGVPNLEARGQLVAKAPHTIRNLRIIVAANTMPSGSSSITTRKNGGNGNCTVSIGAGLTGAMEDTANTDTLAPGDKFNGWYGGSGSGSLTIPDITVEQSGLNSYVVATFQDVSQAINTTQYLQLGARTRSTTEADCQVRAGVVDVFKNLNAYITGNSVNGTSTLDLRANAASPASGPTISISTLVTGFLEDLTGAYTTAVSDLINLRMVLPAGTGSMSYGYFSLQQGKGPLARLPFPRIPAVQRALPRQVVRV